MQCRDDISTGVTLRSRLHVAAPHEARVSGLIAAVDVPRIAHRRHPRSEAQHHSMSLDSPLHAIVVGAGIGGLTAALVLARKGLRVSVHERAPAFSEIGAGIQISPNASRLLCALGLEPGLRELASAPAAIEMRSWRGERLFTQALGVVAEQRFCAPYLNLHRADLHRLLVDAIAGEARIELQLGAAVATVEQAGEIVRLQLENGQTRQADLVIGADGIRSAVRGALFGPERPRYTGCVAWRGVIPVDALAAHRPATVSALWMGPGAHFVHYYVRGGRLLNFVAVVEQPGWEAESWSERGRKENLVAAFAGWHPGIAAITEAADPEGCYRWGLFDRPPMPAWTSGRITLLGDACHPMLPFMAQGACMAIEDAVTLGECLAADGDVVTALRRYEAARRPRTAAVQQKSRINKTLYHLRGTPARLRDLTLPRTAALLAQQIDRLFAFDALAATRQA